MHQKVEGIVLNAVTTGDNDRLCTILTDKLGVIAAYAKGARNMKNKNFTATAQFVYGSFDLFRHRGSFTIDESEYEELNLGLRDDIVRLSVAQYLCQLSMELAPEGEAAGEYLPVLRAAFYYLCGETRDPKLIKAAAELRLMSLSGYMPDLVMCASCGAYEHDRMYFFPSSAQIRCGNCAPGGGEDSLPLSRGALTAMRHTVLSDVRKLYAFSLSGESLGQFYRASEAFVLCKLEKKLTALAFLRTLL